MAFLLMKFIKRILPVLIIFFLDVQLHAQSVTQNPSSLGKTNNWTKADLLEPAALAALIKNPNAKKPLIFNIGVVDDIKGAKNLGATSEKENLGKFRKTLQGLPKSTFLVVYCGCCPFSKCPNIRPAVALLKDMNFTNARLLNLPTNIKTDWIAKGYPLASE